MLLHDPTAAELEQFIAPGGGMEAMVDLKRQGVVTELGLGCLELHYHTKFMAQHESSIALTVNDYNLVRRRCEHEVYPKAIESNVSVINAGCFYMGLLGGLPPAESFSMGFKSTLEVDDLIALATRMFYWYDSTTRI